MSCYRSGNRQLKSKISRVNPEFLMATSPLTPSAYLEVFRKKDAGRGGVERHNKSFNSPKLTSDKFIAAEAIGLFF